MLVDFGRRVTDFFYYVVNFFDARVTTVYGGLLRVLIDNVS